MNETRDQFGRPLRDLRISVTDRCNFRCGYCMPKEVFGSDYHFLDRKEVLTFEEIARLARIFVSHGVQKIRLTGGEPLVRKDLPLLVKMLAEIPGLDLTLTTNGSLLERQAQVRIEHYAQERAAARQAGTVGKQRIVGQHGADAGEDGIGGVTHAMHFGASGF